MSPASRRLLRISISLTALFLAGMSVGIIGTKLYAQRTIRSMILDGPRAILPIGVAALDRELDLTSDQQAKIMEIIIESFKENQKLRGPIIPAQRQLLKTTAEKIFAILDKRQQGELKLDDILANIESRMDKTDNMGNDPEMQRQLIEDARRN